MIISAGGGKCSPPRQRTGTALPPLPRAAGTSTRAGSGARGRTGPVPPPSSCRADAGAFTSPWVCPRPARSHSRRDRGGGRSPGSTGTSPGDTRARQDSRQVPRGGGRGTGRPEPPQARPTLSGEMPRRGDSQGSSVPGEGTAALPAPCQLCPCAAPPDPARGGDRAAHGDHRPQGEGLTPATATAGVNLSSRRHRGVPEAKGTAGAPTPPWPERPPAPRTPHAPARGPAPPRCR